MLCINYNPLVILWPMLFLHLLIKILAFLLMGLWLTIISLVFTSLLLLLMESQALIRLFFRFSRHFVKNAPSYLKKRERRSLAFSIIKLAIFIFCLKRLHCTLFSGPNCMCSLFLRFGIWGCETLFQKKKDLKKYLFINRQWMYTWFFGLLPFAEGWLKVIISIILTINQL